MKVLITGHDGYIGAVLAPTLRDAGHEVAGLDSFLFEGCALGPEPAGIPALRLDVRDVEVEDLRGFDAVVHLAAISKDPLGHLDPKRTYEINHLATVRLARLAKRAGVERFVFASSCSLYGAASPNDLLTESAPFNPVTPYGRSKVLAERDLSKVADDDFSPVFLRNATVYGYSPRLRLDLVVNDLVASAFTTGRVVIKSDGTPWRPLVHVEDVARQASNPRTYAPSASGVPRSMNGPDSGTATTSPAGHIELKAAPGSGYIESASRPRLRAAAIPQIQSDFGTRGLTSTDVTRRDSANSTTSERWSSLPGKSPRATSKLSSASSRRTKPLSGSQIVSGKPNSTTSSGSVPSSPASIDSETDCG